VLLSVLSAHALLIAAIFVPYLTLMIGLGYYIYRSGQPCRDDTQPSDREDGRGRDPGPALLRVAA
jgi:hypothetical protein